LIGLVVVRGPPSLQRRAHLRLIFGMVNSMLSGTDHGEHRRDGEPVTPAPNPAGFDYQDAEQHAYALDATGHLQHWWWSARDNVVYRDTWY
jgi:hypothetical protein